MDSAIEELVRILNNAPGLSPYGNKISELASNGDYRGIQGLLSTIPGLSYGADFEKFLDNMIANQNTEEARKNELDMRDTSLLSSGNQLQQLGLSASGVLQTGGANYNGVGAADTSKTNISLQKYAQKMSLAKQMLSMTSQMASAGIYGNAIGQAKKAANVITSSTANSALGALKASEDYGNRSWDDMITELENMNP